MNEDNPDAIFLNPEYLEKLNQVPEVTDDEFREFILTHNYEMPPDLKQYVDEYMSNPLNHANSKVLGWIKDWIEHPEISSLYRDQLFFNSICHAGDQDEYALSDGDGWKFSVPLVSIDF